MDRHSEDNATEVKPPFVSEWPETLQLEKIIEEANKMRNMAYNTAIMAENIIGKTCGNIPPDKSIEDKEEQPYYGLYFDLITEIRDTSTWIRSIRNELMRL